MDRIFHFFSVAMACSIAARVEDTVLLSYFSHGRRFLWGVFLMGVSAPWEV